MYLAERRCSRRNERHMDAGAARLKAKGSNRATHRREEQEPKGEVGKGVTEGGNRGRKAQGDICRRRCELPEREKVVLKQRKEPERRAGELDTRQAQMTLESQQLTRCYQAECKISNLSILAGAEV